MEGNGQAPQSASPAEKRDWAAAWAQSELVKNPDGATGAALLGAIKARFGAGISHRVCGAIMRDARDKLAVPGYMAPEQPGDPAGSGEPGVPSQMTVPQQTTPAAAVVEDVLELIKRMRALGINSFHIGGREFAVP